MEFPSNAYTNAHGLKCNPPSLPRQLLLPRSLMHTTNLQLLSLLGRIRLSPECAIAVCIELHGPRQPTGQRLTLVGKGACDDPAVRCNLGNVAVQVVGNHLDLRLRWRRCSPICRGGGVRVMIGDHRRRRNVTEQTSLLAKNRASGQLQHLSQNGYG